MAKQSQARAKVALDPSDFEKGAKAIISAANSMSSAVTTAMAATGVAIAAVFGVESLKAIGNSAYGVITLGEEMANAGKKAGLAAGQFYLFHNAIEKGLSLKTVANLIGENAAVLNQSANTFRDVSIKLWVVGEKIRGFWLGLMERVAPVLSRLLDGALGVSLVKAGEDFGNALANAAETLFQIISDGDLWKNVVTVAAASFVYLGNILSGVVGIAMSDAFAKGWDAFTEYGKASMEWFADNFQVLFFSVIFRIETAFNDMFIKVIATFAKQLNVIPGMGPVIDKLAKVAIAGSNKTGQAAQDSIGGVTAPPKLGGNKSVADQFKDLFKNTKFEIPNIDGKPGQKISDIFQKYFDEFNSKNPNANAPGENFENNKRQQAYGVDSLAAIGGGGNVYLGLGILDYTRMSYQELREMNRKLDSADKRKSPAFQLMQSGIDSDVISRAQVSNVV